MTKPELSTVPEYYRFYIQVVPYDNLIQGLIQSGDEAMELIRSIHEGHADYRYDEGKWSIKELFSHIIDVERIFNYRAMRFARNDSTVLPGFDENAYVPESGASDRRLYKIADELVNLRASTVDLFASFSDEMLERKGTASGVEISVNAIGYVNIGHMMHHCSVIKDRYL